MSTLSATARVILGLLKFAPRTGYDVKRVTDFSTRFFWRASYGQIYPELRTLEEAGLVRSREEPYGRRRRRVYELTAEGERSLDEWLHSETTSTSSATRVSCRLFFGELVSDEDVLALVRRRREIFENHAALFRQISGELGEIEGPSAEVLRYGIESMDWNVAWWADLERRLDGSGC